MPKRILFLSAFVGTGHTSAAEAVKKALEELDPETDARIVDSYTFASVIFRKVASQGYIQLVKFLPQLYSFLYDLHEKDSAVNVIKSRFTLMMVKNFRKLMKEFSPHVLVCTHAFPSGVASILKEEYNIPTVSIVTDFTVHPFWIHQNTNLYVVGNSQLSLHLQERGIPPERIRVTGIPVDPQFGSKRDKKQSKRMLGLEEAVSTILVMGGGAGLGPIGWILRSLRNVKHVIQVIVVTGVNRGLRKRMESYAQKLNGNKKKKSTIKLVKVYGFVDNIHELMNAADLLISKPGGLTSSEALAAELPILIVRPLPGQEVRNSQYLLKEHAAVLVKRGKNVSRMVEQLLDNPQSIAKLQERARALKKPNAAYDAARGIIELIRDS